MGNLGQAPEEVTRVLEASDPRLVHLELDTAHYAQAGGDPADAVRRHGDRLLFLHVKDVESPLPGGGPASYRFVELGRGKVDFPAFFAALRNTGFRGWAIGPARGWDAHAEGRGGGGARLPRGKARLQGVIGDDA